MTQKQEQFQTFIKDLDKITKTINNSFVKASGFLILLIAVLVFYDVIRRYFFNDPSSWTLDLSRYLLVYVVFLSLAPALESGQHVSVDLVNEFASKRIQKWLSHLVCILTIGFGLIFFWKTLGVTIDAALDNKMSASQISIPMKYVYVIAPVGLMQFTLTALKLYLISFSQNPINVDETLKVS